MLGPRPSPHPLATIPAALAAGILSILAPIALGSAGGGEWAALLGFGAILVAASAAAGFYARTGARALGFCAVATTTAIAAFAVIRALRGGASPGPVNPALVAFSFLVAFGIVGMPVLAMSMLAAAVAHATPGAKRRRAPPHGSCPNCGYDRRDLPVDRCPECNA